MAKIKRATNQIQLQEGYNNDTLPMDQLQAISNSRINRNLKKVAMQDPSINPLVYLNDKDVPKSDIIEESVKRIKVENDQSKLRIQQELSKTPNRDRLRKLTAVELLQIQALNSGGVR